MFQIRGGTFETNSSSAHSLVIMKEGIEITAENFDIEADTWIGHEGRLKFWQHDLVYDRSPYRVLASVGDKLGYVVAACRSDEEIKRVIAGIKSRIPAIKKVEFPTDWETDETLYGWIDHQSIGMLPYALHKENIDPVDIVLNTRYIIVVDGDEYCIFDRMVRNGLINSDAIEKVYDYHSAYRDAHPEIYGSEKERGGGGR